MSSSNGTTEIHAIPQPVREPPRLRMAERGHRNSLDGGWWPHSRDLAAELGGLVAGMAPESGRIVRALFSPPDWDTAPRRIPMGAGYLKVGSFPDDDTHLMLLTTSDRRVLRMLVVPPGFTKAQADEALLAASTPGNSHSAAELLAEVLEHPDVDAMDLWTDDGGS
ncbi:DUF5994 family protein [Nocardioides maradonensis]